MKNADKPISPFYHNNRMQTETTIDNYSPYLFGLTKREYFAAMAMQGLMSMPNKGNYSTIEESIKIASELSIKVADELLKQLEQ